MIMGLIQEEINTVNICAPNIGEIKYVKQVLTDTKEKIVSNRIIRLF